MAGRWWRVALVSVWMCVAGSASAQTTLVFEGCVDARGTPVRSVADPTLANAFETRVEGNAPVIRYNASVPPDVSELARMFFYSHECARIGLGIAANAPRSVGDAWRADCRALGTLVHSGLIREGDIPALQAQIDALDANALRRLPGPPRAIDLQACSRALKGDRVLLPQTPGGGETQWNTCVQPCADRLLQCQRSTCGGVDCPACLPAHEACVARCNG